MDFELREDQKMFRKSLAELLDKELAPRVDEYEKGEYPFELAQKLGELGYLGVTLPTEYGGGGADMVTLCIYAEELAKYSGGIASALLTSTAGPVVIAKEGTEEQKRKYIPPIMAGKQAAAFSVTEAEAGSDVAGLKTTSTKKKGYYEINGTKMFSTNAYSASIFVLLARQAESTEGKYNLFIIEKDTPGLAVPKKLDKLGFRAMDCAEIVLENVRVPEENLIGSEGRGLSYVLLLPWLGGLSQGLRQ